MVICTLKDTNTIKLTFCCKVWVYLLLMTLFGWFWWCLQLTMVYKMSQEFLTASLDITSFTCMWRCSLRWYLQWPMRHWLWLMYSRNRQASKIPNILVSFVIITTIISNAQILKRLPALFTKHMMGAGQLVTVQKSKQKSNIIYTESHSHTHTLSLSHTHTHSLSHTHTHHAHIKLSQTGLG